MVTRSSSSKPHVLSAHCQISRAGMFGVLAVLFLLVVACTQPAPTPTPTVMQPPVPAPSPTVPLPGTPTPQPAEGQAVVQVTDHADLGPILTNGDGQVLYLFTRDEREVSNCAGGCLQAWPPLFSDGEPIADHGLAADRLGLIEHAEGGMQVTYNGWPLYYYAGDMAAGEANGQGAGGVWFAVSPGGEAVAMEPGLSPTVAPTPTQPAQIETIQVIGRNFSFSPASISLRAQSAYRIDFTSADSFHTFTVRNPSGLIVLNINASGGATASAEFTPAAAGTYSFFCQPHAGLGMTGQIQVTN